MIKFDSAKRKEYLTGFHKRKQARKWKGMVEVMAKERQDRIDVKKDVREQVKQNWKDLQRSQALTNKALSRLGISDADDRGAKYLKDDSESEDDRGAKYLEDDVPKPKKKAEAQKMICFEKEEDDPFGDCEVTTTAFEAAEAASSSITNTQQLSLYTNISSAWTGEGRTWEGEDAAADEVAATRFEKQRKRVVVRKKEEKREKEAMERRVAKRLGFKKKSKKGNDKKDSKKGDCKNTARSSHGARKIHAKKQQKKHG